MGENAEYKIKVCKTHNKLSTLINIMNFNNWINF